MKYIAFILLTILHFSAAAQMGICYNAYVWSFSTNQTEKDSDLPDAEEVTEEFESLLSTHDDYNCHLLQRRNFSSIEEHMDAEQARRELAKGKGAVKDTLQLEGAEVVILGRIEVKKDNTIKLWVSFQALVNARILRQDYQNLPRSSWVSEYIRRDSLNSLIGRLLQKAYSKKEAVPQNNVNPTPNPLQVASLSGKFEFQLNNNTPMPALRLSSKAPIIGRGVQKKAALGTYRMKKPYTSGTEYQMLLTQNQGAYSYVFGSDLATGILYDLFPLEGQNAYLLSGEKIALPPDNYIQLDTTKGLDYMCILTSPKAIDMTAFKTAYQTATGSFTTRVSTALQGKLASESDVIFENDFPAFQKRTTDDKIVITIIEIEHL